MNITKEKLTKIIAEEIEKTLNELNFDQQTGEPLNKEGERICAGNPRCFKAHILPLFKGDMKFSTRTGQPLDVLKKAASAFWSEKAPGSAKADSARSLGDKPQRYREDPKTGKLVPKGKEAEKSQPAAPKVDNRKVIELARKAILLAKAKDPSWISDIKVVLRKNRREPERSMKMIKKIIQAIELD